jgi:hypothetical protein
VKPTICVLSSTVVKNVLSYTSTALYLNDDMLNIARRHLHVMCNVFMLPSCVVYSTTVVKARSWIII